MSVEDDAGAIDSRINSIFAATGDGYMAPQIASYQGSATFQSMVQDQQNTAIMDGAAVQNPSSGSIDDRPINAPPDNFKSIMQDAAANNGVELPLIEAVAKNESGFNPNATSPTGAQGLMQLEPGTASGLGVTNSYDPVQNINGGAKYLRGLLDQFHGNLPEAIAAYNAGPGAVQKYGGIPPYAETQNYVQNVMASYERYRAQTAMDAAPASARNASS